MPGRSWLCTYAASVVHVLILHACAVLALVRTMVQVVRAAYRATLEPLQPTLPRWDFSISPVAICVPACGTAPGHVD